MGGTCFAFDHTGQAPIEIGALMKRIGAVFGKSSHLHIMTDGRVSLICDEGIMVCEEMRRLVFALHEREAVGAERFWEQNWGIGEDTSSPHHSRWPAKKEAR